MTKRGQGALLSSSVGDDVDDAPGHDNDLAHGFAVNMALNVCIRQGDFFNGFRVSFCGRFNFSASLPVDLDAENNGLGLKQGGVSLRPGRVADEAGSAQPFPAFFGEVRREGRDQPRSAPTAPRPAPSRQRQISSRR